MVTHPIHMPVPVLPHREGGSSAPAGVRNLERGDSFLDAMLELPLSKYTSRNPLEWLVSLILHILVVGALLLIPLYFTDTLEMKALTQTFLVLAGPPPPPPPAAPTIPKIVHAPLTRLLKAGKLTAPTSIPKTIAMIKEAPLPPEPSVGVVGGVPGGIPGGQLGGVLGGIIGGAGRTFAPQPPPPTVEKRIVRVGGVVKEPRPMFTPSPIYPTIAKVAKVQGVVEIEAIIDEHGDVVSAHAVSGHGLLIGPALNAVLTWKYQPTLLNGEPVSVLMRVTVNFQLSQ